MRVKSAVASGAFRELLHIYKNLWTKTRLGGKWTTLDRMFFWFAVTMVAAVFIITISIAALLKG